MGSGMMHVSGPGWPREEDAMKALNRKSPIWHAVIWIVAYVVLVNVGDWLSELIGGPNFVTPLLLVVFSIGLIIYVARNGWLNYYGLGPLRRNSFTGTWLYIPMVVIMALQYFWSLDFAATVPTRTYAKLRSRQRG